MYYVIYRINKQKKTDGNKYVSTYEQIVIFHISHYHAPESSCSAARYVLKSILLKV